MAGSNHFKKSPRRKASDVSRDLSAFSRNSVMGVLVFIMALLEMFSLRDLGGMEIFLTKW